MAGERDNCTRRMGTRPRPRPRRRRRPVHARITHGIQGKVPMPICGAEPSAPPSPPSPCMHGMATASPVSAGCRGDDDRRRHVAHPGRRPAGMPFSGDRATARNQCEQQGKAFHVERARGKLRRNLCSVAPDGLGSLL